MNIVIPCAGLGSRFRDAGYETLKPLLPVGDRTMIEAVIDNLAGPNDNVYVICMDEHFVAFQEVLMDKAMVNYLVVPTRGTVSTALTLKKFINNDEPLIIANCDQVVDFDREAWLERVKDVDGDLLTFTDTSPKWSFVELGEDGYATRVVAKKAISDITVVGVYYFSKGRYFVEAGEEMIANQDTTNGEYYICPSYNYMIRKGMKITTTRVEKMFALGVPEDYEANKDLR